MGLVHFLQPQAGRSMKSRKVLKFDFSGDEPPDFRRIDLTSIESLVVEIPLPSFGSSNSHMDLCGDLLDASWAIDHLASSARQFEIKFGTGYFKPNINVTLHQPSDDLTKKLKDLRLVFQEATASVSEEQQLQDLRNDIADHADKIDDGSTVAPEIADHYLGNLMAAYGEIKSEHPEWYAGDMKRFPERTTGYFRSAYSTLLGVDIFASWNGWILPSSIALDDFFSTLGMEYRSSDFEPAEVFIFPDGAFVRGDGFLVSFPSDQYFRSRVCAGLARMNGDEDAYHSETFRWSLGGRTSHVNEMWDATGQEAVLGRWPSKNALVHSMGSLVIVNDGQDQHLLFSTQTLHQRAAKSVGGAVAHLLEGVSATVGGIAELKFEWSSLSDEQFEELCYDIIDADPKFDSETIQKMGKSRSRDGGRDIVVREARRWPSTEAPKWIFQCKLVTNGTSLGGAKLLDIGDTIDQYGAQGFGIMTSAPIDATLHDKIEKVCGQRRAGWRSWSVYEISRILARNPTIRKRYFPA